MRLKHWIMLLVMVFLLTTSTIASEPVANSAATWKINVTLASPIYLSTPRPIQDIYFVLNNTTPNMAYRVELDQAKDPMNLAREAYATTNATPHDTYKIMPHPLGPFPKGVDLGLTLGQWIAATGKGIYIEKNGSSTLNLTFRKLVPNGTYTIWCNRITMPPNYKEVLTPIGASDGSQNVFRADAKGNYTFNLKLEALPASTNITWEDYSAMYVTKKAPISTNITWTLISVVFHSDGRTHNATPGDWGKTAHSQLFHLMYPKPIHTFQEWRNATIVAATTQTQKKQPGFEGIFAIAGILAVSYIVINRQKTLSDQV
jgi:hypothetical protein